ncbi:HAD-like domain-containing protein [Sparassis latifolia]|uniref:Uncharacterized CDP-alcohol phosphatidyltransferase class-I family protein n=1 Tax=Sparassis crispa TaxID=139825 RepID=A0A401GG15_9APHY|nr:Uncharacterized CDP-alcohol phosphatidyltransferase class-I family protein [Sparassis crispa]GBE81065.1 Uncharacterized CDP-alcohol phosphatidyltransferase class-I family protein [Sparassis crispa]
MNHVHMHVFLRPSICRRTCGRLLALNFTRRTVHPLTRTFAAFAFDIDGVLLRGSQTIDAAKRALSILEGNNPTGMKIPYILVTNGGGASEEARCQKLSKQLGYQILPSQFVQSHTVLKSVVDLYADHPVLVLGGKDDDIRRVAEGYGFKEVYTTLDVHAWNPAIWPYHELTQSERKSVKDVDFTQTPISAIFVFHDPRNWALDIQIICDIILSGGIPGGPPKVTLDLEHPPVKLVFCNPDLLWKAGYSQPRLGEGAFRVAFQAVFKALTGSEYPYVQYGKPTKATYEYATRLLQRHYKALHGRHIDPQHVYMVGDNPDSDIAGANAAGWSSILVHTGVYDPHRGPPSHPPTHEVDDVEEAVKWAIERELHRGTCSGTSQ